MVYITSYSAAHTLTRLDAGIHTVPENIDKITKKIVKCIAIVMHTNPCVNCTV